MAVAEIPLGLVPITSSYNIRGPKGARRTEVKGGFNRYALDFDQGTLEVSVTLKLESFQFQMWQLFFHNTIKKGTIPFSMTLDTGFGVVPHTCYIVPDTYNVNLADYEDYVVSFVVETESVAYTYGPADTQSLLDVYALYNKDADKTLKRIATFATEDVNVLTITD